MDDDIPPPPYSAQDPNRPAPASQPIIGNDIQAYNAFIPIPPALPTSSSAQHHGVAAAGPSSQSPSSPSQPPPAGTRNTIPLHMATTPPVNTPQPYLVSEELRRTGFVSAHPYFELRAPALPRPSDTLFHHMIIAPDASPDNLPFPQPADRWARREVDSHDWMTFLNHLFPQHSVKGKGRGIEAKELEEMALATAGTEKFAGTGRALFEQGSRFSRGPLGPNGPSDGLFTSGPLSPGSPLGNLFSGGSMFNDGGSPPEQSLPLLESSSTDNRNGSEEQMRRTRIEAVIDQWNDGFFRPRGLGITANIEPLSPPEQPEQAARRSSSNVLQKRPPPEVMETLLHQAVGKGKKSEVETLLEKGGEDLEALNRKGETALFRAVSKGEKSIVELLLKHGANSNVRGGSENNTALYTAVSQDKKTILKYLLEKSTAGIEERSFIGETPLYLAVRRQRNSCVELLLEFGADVNSRPVGQESMLNVAVNWDQKPLTKILLKKRELNIEERNKDGDTPLCRSVSRGNTSMAKLLLEHGANAEARSSKGEAPLSIAASRGDSSIVTLLLAQKTIDTEPENAKGETPLYTAITRGDTSIAQQLLRKGANSLHIPVDQESMLNIAVARGSSSLTQLLVQSGSDVEERNRASETPLFQAVSKSDTSIVSLLIAKGADPNTRNASGEPVLYRAMSRGSTSAVSLLLGAGANPEVSAPGGEAPLYRAVMRGDSSIVSLLLCHGARTDTRSPGGEIPLYRAVKRDDRSVVSLLLGNGADPEATCVGDFGETVLEYAERKRGASKNGTILQLLTMSRRPRVAMKT